ncbi:MAG: TraB/GumN family protein, partial [Caulobacteraceae bacterium]|nr:TraB/GumN family protein [Caulobacteraceae bacterium]
IGAAGPAASGGPAWWRVSDGKAVLWILAIPDGMMMDVRWNDAALRTRLAAAELLLSPMLGDPIKEPPRPCFVLPNDRMGRVRCAAPLPNNTIPTTPRDSTTDFTDYVGPPLSRSLPADLNQRVERQLARTNSNLRGHLLHDQPAPIALWLDTWNWPRGVLGNPVTRKAQDIAHNARLATRQIPLRGTWRPQLLDPDAVIDPELSNEYREFLSYARGPPNVRAIPPEDVQLRCLREALDMAESGSMPALRQAAQEAWARGDVEHALKRAGPIQLCLMGDQPSSDPAAFLQSRAFTYEDSLDQAFGSDLKQTVALVEFDPLLMPGGILDHYRQLGYDIVQTDGIDSRPTPGANPPAPAGAARTGWSSLVDGAINDLLALHHQDAVAPLQTLVAPDLVSGQGSLLSLDLGGAVIPGPAWWKLSRLDAPPPAAPANGTDSPAQLSEAQTNAPSPEGPTAEDQVSGLVIRAAPRAVAGPAWWEVRKGEAVVWIMGTPDLLPLNTNWNDAGLRQLLDGARGVIVPAKAPAQIIRGPILFRLAEGLGAVIRAKIETDVKPSKTPLTERLPPPLMDRLKRRIRFNPELAKREQSAFVESHTYQGFNALISSVPSPLDLIQYGPNEYMPTSVVALNLSKDHDFPGELGKPAAIRAEALAGRQGLFINRLKDTESDLSHLALSYEGPEADQEACLSQVLDQLDAGNIGVRRLPAVQAWALGDVGRAMKRMNVMTTCNYGAASTVLWNRLVKENVDAIQAALNAGGKTVAIVEFDPLQMKGGVLDQLKAAGLVIRAPEGG